MHKEFGNNIGFPVRPQRPVSSSKNWSETGSCSISTKACWNFRSVDKEGKKSGGWKFQIKKQTSWIRENHRVNSIFWIFEFNSLVSLVLKSSTFWALKPALTLPINQLLFIQLMDQRPWFRPELIIKLIFLQIEVRSYFEYSTIKKLSDFRFSYDNKEFPAIWARNSGDWDWKLVEFRFEPFFKIVLTKPVMTGDWRKWHSTE